MAPFLNRLASIKCTIYVIVFTSLVIILLTNSLLFGWSDSTNHVVSPIGTINISNGTKYVLPCEVSDPEAIVAITNAVSDECKIKIANAACKNAQGKLTPRSIVNHCPRGGFIPYRLLGCYPTIKLTVSSTIADMPDNTPKRCVDFCTQRNFRYAFVQKGHYCYCVDEKPNPKEKLSDLMCNYACPGNPALNCGGMLEALAYETGLAKHPIQPFKMYPNPKDKPVRIAFLLIFHKRNLRQVHRLIRAIYDKTHYYFIHVDPKQHYLFRELMKLEKDFPNIYVSRQRHNITWACFTQLQALLASMKDIVTKWNPDYILNMSESDFPVKTVAKLTEFLTANRGRNFLEMQTVTSIDKFITDSGYNKNFLECDNRMWLIGDRQLPTGIVTNGGSDWFCLSREFIQYALDDRHDLVADVKRIMEHTIFGTENFFQQVLLNSHFCQTYYSSGLRLVSWAYGFGCSVRRTIDWRGCSPLIIRRESWPDIQKTITGDVYAVRKFNPIFDQKILLIVEEYAFGRYPSNVPNLSAYWENVYHHEDKYHGPRMNAVLNVAYVLLYINAQSNGYEHYEVMKVFEITHYFNRNTFEGFLIRHLALVNDQPFELEVFVKPVNRFTPSKTLKGELINVMLEMSNTIEVVERNPLDFDQVLSADKRPMLVFYLPRDKIISQTNINHTVTVEWIDPHQQSVVVENYTINEDPDTIERYSLQSTALNMPLLEGVWRAKVTLNETYIGTVDFMVASNELIVLPRLSTAASVCNRSSGLFKTFSCNIKNSYHLLQKHAHFATSVQNSFHVESMCIIDGEVIPEQLNFRPLVNCSATLWSTLAPDPKSDVHNRIQKRV